MAKYKIKAGTWFDRKLGKCMVRGDDVEFTEKQAIAFGKSNLVSYAALEAAEAEAKAAAEAAEAEAKAAAEAAEAEAKAAAEAAAEAEKASKKSGK
jgi:hypothetical protein